MAQVASKVCEICEGGHGKYHCQECDQLFCENCKMIHTRQRISKNHTYLTVSNTNMEDKMFSNGHMSVTKVNRRSTTDPSESTKNKLEKLQTESLMNIEDKVARAKSCISQMDDTRKSYRENIKKVIHTITEDGDDLKKLIDQKVDEFRNMIRDEEQKEIEKMVTYNKGCRAVLQKFQSLEKDIKAVVASTDVHIQLLQKMKQFNTDVDSVELQEVPDEPNVPYRNKKLSDTDKENLFGKLQFPDTTSAQKAIIDNKNETRSEDTQKQYKYRNTRCRIENWHTYLGEADHQPATECQHEDV
ncbi:Hypothetical predicted protein [Mytilus galloprovincialis]|uniref:B box-type domain-containing protein n=1 Tax=Mytilus galloprovincialis TaxID=29158 RepID=A0A8B6HRS1_MYTGA|nr:Hypothetical predicted protein [Mytilus galloprovincialis]